MTFKEKPPVETLAVFFFGVYTYSCKPFRSSNESTTF